MTNQTTVKVTADASGYTAELDKGRRSAEAFMQTQEKAAERVRVAQQAIAEAAQNGSNASAKAISNFVSQLARTADQAGKTRAELLQMRAAQLGIADSVSGYVQQLDEASKHTHEFSLNSSAARREMLVLAHEASQGNWTRFAGSMGVLAERTDALTLLLSPLGLGLGATAAAAALVAVEIAKGHEQVEAFNRAISSTNGYVGLSAAQMAEMSNGLVLTTAHLSSVREAMAQVAATGAFTADDLQLATRAALAMSSDIGIGTDKAAESLSRVQENVLEWVQKYQQAHHAFSAAQVEEIDNFVKQGDTARAVKAVMQDLSSAHEKMAADAEKSVGYLAWLWNAAAYSIDFYKSKLQNLGVPDSVDKQVGDQFARVEAAQRNLKQQQSMGAMGNISSAQQALDIEMQKLNVLRQQQGEVNKLQRAREAAAKAGDATVDLGSYLRSDKYANPSEKHQHELDAEGKAFSQATATLDKNSADYQAALKRHYANVKQIADEYAKRTAPKTNEGGLNATLAAIQGANQLIEAEERRAQATLKAQHQSGLVDTETYLSRLRDLQARALDQEIANAQRRAELAGQKKDPVAEQQALTEYKKLVADRLAVEQSYTQSLSEYQAKRTANVQKFSVQEAAALQKQQQGYGDLDATRYMTALAKSEYESRGQLVEQYMQKVASLKEHYEMDPASDKKEYAAKLQSAQASYDQQLAALQTYLTREQAVRESFSDQMHLAVSKLAGDGQTTAQMLSSAFTTAWQDSANALDKFITTGKGSFEEFTASILADLAKIAVHQAEMQLFQTIGTSFFSEGGSVGHYASGGPIAGPGTGTSDSIPAMLSNGEFVVRASQASKYRSLLESINSGTTSHFANGGLVGPSAASSNGGVAPVSVVVHNNGGGGMSDQDAKDLHTLVQAFVDRRIDQKMRGQGSYSYQIKYGMI
ncbi:phage tail length tape measure family protein [Trinickia sp. NRRL B-1857]|uniref:phage tail length tape measure family protein n=1 Tax=Trinickia sp. NRRL B-1857 TaxID=3162879 RepID=UPI003D2BB983